MRSISRRGFLLTAAATAGIPLKAQAPAATARRVVEWSFVSARSIADPFHDINLDVIVSDPAGREQRVPAFWAGGQTWRVRYAAEAPGRYGFRSVCSDTSNAALHGVSGTTDVSPYDGSHPLYQQGGLRVAANKRHFEHADGTPFFWMGDTWWLGLSKRLRWPEDFQQLAADRVAKGYNVIQIIAGLYPDMGSFDPRGANEAGFPWEKDYTRINPAYFDMADLRIRHLVDVGLTPCIVGCWGYYLPILGMERIQQHWRYLIARWGAYPVVWCLAGEGSMPWYASEHRDEDKAAQETGWTRMAGFVRETDPFHRMITIHPSRASRDVVTDPSTVDFEMLQTGHSDYQSIPNTVREAVKARGREPRMPVINSEVCYEGIQGRCRQDIQRFMFWASVLSGTCGHTYGANGIWQLNLPGDPFGPSPHGRTWGNAPWQEAAQYPGGRQVGIGAQLLRRYPWHRIEPHPEWVDPRWSEQNFDLPYAAGIPGELRIIYTPTMWDPPAVKLLEKGVSYKATLFDPSTGEPHEVGKVSGDAAGEFKLSHFPVQQDWVLILERV
jgi:hypothetical protein